VHCDSDGPPGEDDEAVTFTKFVLSDESRIAVLQCEKEEADELERKMNDPLWSFEIPVRVRFPECPPMCFILLRFFSRYKPCPCYGFSPAITKICQNS